MKTIKVVGATYLNEYKLVISFNDETKQVVDFGKFLKHHNHPVFDKYKDIQYFKSFKIDSGNVVWGENWDLIFSHHRTLQRQNKSITQWLH
jgi:Protein of unknown function (DUF2442)